LRHDADGVGGDLVIVFLGLEILSICHLRARRLSAHGRAFERVFFEVFHSRFVCVSVPLYGIALVYGATATGPDQPGTTNIALIAARADHSLYPPLLLAGLAMMLVGFGFKIATAPFHVWTPDVYEGAPSPVTAFMACGPKAAGFASFMRGFSLSAFPIATTAASTAGFAHKSWFGRLSDHGAS
jgi:NADH-quinone oxidoreductase subunit N